jgi:hypothetical protein
MQDTLYSETDARVDTAWGFTTLLTTLLEIKHGGISLEKLAELITITRAWLEKSPARGETMAAWKKVAQGKLSQDSFFAKLQAKSLLPPRFEKWTKAVWEIAISGMGPLTTHPLLR